MYNSVVRCADRAQLSVADMTRHQCSLERHVHPTTGLSYLSSTAVGTDPLPNSSAEHRHLTVVLIHGYACRAVDFVPLIDYLMGSGKVIAGRFIQYIAFDLPGHDQTPITVCPSPNIPNFSSLVLRTLVCLGVEDFVILGHSMGCRVALTVTAYALYESHPPANEDANRLTSNNCLLSSYPNPIAAVLLDGAITLQKTRPHAPPSTVNLALPSSSNDPLERLFAPMFTPAVPSHFREEVLDHVRTRDQAYIRELKDNICDLDEVVTFLASKGTSEPVSEISRRECKSPYSLPILVLQSTFQFFPIASSSVSNPPTRLSFTSPSFSESPTIQYLQHHLRQNLRYRILCFRGHFPHVEGKVVVNDDILALKASNEIGIKTGTEEVGEAIWDFWSGLQIE